MCSPRNLFGHDALSTPDCRSPYTCTSTALRRSLPGVDGGIQRVDHNRIKSTARQRFDFAEGVLARSIAD